MKPLALELQKYFDSYDGQALKWLHQVRNLIFDLLPEAEETIKYGIPTVLHHGNLVHYAAFKNHLGFYPIPSGVEAFAELLKDYKQGKGSIQFPYTKELPLDIIRKIVEFRIRENEQKAKGK